MVAGELLTMLLAVAGERPVEVFDAAVCEGVGGLVREPLC